MNFKKAARRILSVTALAWSIPLAQAAETRQPGIPEAQANSAELRKLDVNRGGALGFGVKDVKDGLQVRD